MRDGDGAYHSRYGCVVSGRSSRLLGGDGVVEARVGDDDVGGTRRLEAWAKSSTFTRSRRGVSERNAAIIGGTA